MMAPPAERTLNFHQAFPKIYGIALIIELKDRIQKLPGTRFAIDCIGFVDRRGKNRWSNTCKIGNRLSCRAQVSKSIAKIGSKRHGSPHLKCSRARRATCKLPEKRSRQGCHY